MGLSFKRWVIIGGLFINVSNCEMFGHGDQSSFSPEMKVSLVPNLEILGAPIDDPIFCAKFLAQKHADAAKLVSKLTEVGAEDPRWLSVSYGNVPHSANWSPLPTPHLLHRSLRAWLYLTRMYVNASLNETPLTWIGCKHSSILVGMDLAFIACHVIPLQRT